MNRNLRAWLVNNPLPFRDYRFWLIQALNLIACIQLATIPTQRTDSALLAKTLENSLIMKSFILIFLIAALASALIFGLPSTVLTIFITALFAAPKFISWSSLPYDNFFLARMAVIGIASLTVGYLVSREKATRLRLQILNEKMKEMIHQKERFFKLASEAQENERKRISRDLHDDSLQLLASVIHQLDGALGAESPNEATAQMVRAKETITQTTESIRRYCEALRPMLLDTLGLLPAVEWIGRELEQSAGIKVSFDIDGEPRLIKEDDRIHTFRVMQEAFHNIEKHSKATAARVHWKFNADELVIAVTDNGIGMWDFDPTSRRSLGIQGMHERMELIGGRLEIESQPGFGTKVTLEIPYE